MHVTQNTWKQQRRTQNLVKHLRLGVVEDS